MRDGKEIFCRESLRLTAVGVKAKGDTVDLSAPSTLFEVAAHQARHHTSARSCFVGRDISDTRWAAVDTIVFRAGGPYRYANQLPFQVENYILNVKREHASWGARKIRKRLMRRYSGIKIPAKSTIHAVLDRYGLVERRGRLRRRAQGTALSLGNNPNELWCTDYKGEFLLGNRHYCYPLTVTDHAIRYLLCCAAHSSTCEDYAFAVWERLFKERGLPDNIRSDNGVPFASAHALFNLSKPAVWWLRLGIGIERIRPGHPCKMAVMSACISP